MAAATTERYMAVYKTLTANEDGNANSKGKSTKDNPFKSDPEEQYYVNVHLEDGTVVATDADGEGTKPVTGSSAYRWSHRAALVPIESFGATPDDVLGMHGGEPAAVGAERTRPSGSTGWSAGSAPILAEPNWCAESTTARPSPPSRSSPSTSARRWASWGR